MDKGIEKDDEWMVIEREVCMLVKNTMGKAVKNCGCSVTIVQIKKRGCVDKGRGGCQPDNT